MAESRKTSDWLIVSAVVLALVLVPPTIYFGAYLLMTEAVIVDSDSFGGETTAYRFYDSEWKLRLFAPGAAIESFITGRQVQAMENYDVWLDLDEGEFLLRYPAK